jgi:hypothetical protein
MTKRITNWYFHPPIQRGLDARGAGGSGAGFPKLVDLLEPGGLIALSLRHGASEATRAMHPVSADEVHRLGRDNGAFVERCSADEDHLDRPDVRWTRMAVRLPAGRP